MTSDLARGRGGGRPGRARASAPTRPAWPGSSELGAGPVIAERVAAGRPVLGICVGMQILFDSGVEHGVETKGLGLLPGVVTKLTARAHPAHGLEHGRRRRTGPRCSPGCAADARFYFVHSYAASDLDALRRAGAKVTTASHDQPFAAVVELGALSVAQFHPEKSADAGLRAAAQLGRRAVAAMSKERARRRAERLAVLEKEKAARARRVARRQRRRALVRKLTPRRRPVRPALPAQPRASGSASSWCRCSPSPRSGCSSRPGPAHRPHRHDRPRRAGPGRRGARPALLSNGETT